MSPEETGPPAEEPGPPAEEPGPPEGTGPPRTTEEAERARYCATRCFVCGDEQRLGEVERGEDCRQRAADGRRCCGRYVGLSLPRGAAT